MQTLVLLKDNNSPRAGRVALQLRMLPALTEDLVLVPHAHIVELQLSVTPGPGDPTHPSGL